MHKNANVIKKIKSTRKTHRTSCLKLKSRQQRHTVYESRQRSKSLFKRPTESSDPSKMKELYVQLDRLDSSFIDSMVNPTNRSQISDDIVSPIQTHLLSDKSKNLRRRCEESKHPESTDVRKRFLPSKSSFFRTKKDSSPRRRCEESKHPEMADVSKRFLPSKSSFFLPKKHSSPLQTFSRRRKIKSLRDLDNSSYLKMLSDEED
ncbi:hypothetical protein GJ496_011583 [Pomphorhynchus laevis]|nr:hypothetical protein GJ496_011583 [Pomphorhynchus laevis]